MRDWSRLMHRQVACADVAAASWAQRQRRSLRRWRARAVCFELHAHKRVRKHETAPARMPREAAVKHADSGTQLIKNRQLLRARPRAHKWRRKERQHRQRMRGAIVPRRGALFVLATHRAPLRRGRFIVLRNRRVEIASAKERIQQRDILRIAK